MNSKTTSKRVIGVTGRAASGKSTVCKFFSEKGFPIIDADQVAREISMAGGTAIPLVASEMGKQYITTDGELNREQLRKDVFTAPDLLQKLESILHPLMREAIVKKKENFFIDHSLVIFDCAILFQSDLIDQIDHSIGVIASDELCSKRLSERDGTPLANAQSILNNQMTSDLIKSKVDYCLFNDQDITSLRSKAEAILQQILG